MTKSRFQLRAVYRWTAVAPRLYAAVHARHEPCRTDLLHVEAQVPHMRNVVRPLIAHDDRCA